LLANLALDDYRDDAERFSEEIDREYYLHYSGRQESFEIEAIYERHAELFSRAAVEDLRATADTAQGDDRRRLRYLLDFAFHGHLGQALKAEAAELAQLEASLEVDAGGKPIPYRAVPVALANEPDAERRAAVELARDELLAERLNPLHRVVLERTHELAHDLGWASYRVACEELSGIDLGDVARQAREFVAATDDAYAALTDPALERAGVPALGELRRSDLPRFFRAPGLDDDFGRDDLVPAFECTLSGLGIDLVRQDNVHLDTESRPTKSSRAFCATPHVPDEVYLVISPVGGRDDYEAMFHEGGHVEHFAHVDPELPIEYRRLGDNSVTESFAFLIEHLTEDPEWLMARLGVTDPAPVMSHARAVKLVMLRESSGPGRAGSPTSIRPSTSRATCARGRSRPRGVGYCGTGSAHDGSSRRRPGSGCASCGDRASGWTAGPCSSRPSVRSSTSASWPTSSFTSRCEWPTSIRSRLGVNHVRLT
jgi:hypothetical protein